MAIAVEHGFHGVTLDQDDEAIEAGGFLYGSPLPPGWLAHWVTKTDDGFRVRNVFESPEDHEKYFGREMDPLIEELRLPPPEVHFVELHNYLVGTRRAR